MNIIETKVSVLPLKYLHENKGQIEGVPANPRILRDVRYKALLESLRADDLTGVLPLKIYKMSEGEFVVLGGNMRLKALRELKGNDYAVSCVEIPEDTPVEVLRKIVVLDNSTFGEWDFDMLANEWDADELGDWGLDLKQPVEDVEITEDDFDEEKDKVETVCKKGDIWQLGNHRLMCGSSLDEKEVQVLLNGSHAPLTFTDPPYRLATEGGGVLKTANSMKQIKQNGVDEFEPLKLTLYSETNIYSHNKPLIKDYILLAERENKPYDLAIYKKQGLPNYKGHLMTDIEYIAIIGNQNPKQGLAFEQYSKVFVGNKDKENDLSYSKPIALCAKFINLYSSEGDIVLDLFGGSGSTLIACEQLGRKCYMMELDPHYCDVIIARWEKLTGQTATKL